MPSQFVDPDDELEPDEFDPAAIAFDGDARAEAEDAAERGERARQALLDASQLLVSIAAATIEHSNDDGEDDSPFSQPLPDQPTRPTAQQLAAKALRNRFGPR